MNTYFAYNGLFALHRKYQELFDQIENNEGELDEETEIKLKEIEDDYGQLTWDVLEILDALKSEKELNDRRIKNLGDKNSTLTNSETFLKKFLKDLIKSQGEINKTGNKTLKVGERSVTVIKGTGYEVTDKFNDDRFIRYSFSKIDPKYKQGIEAFLLSKGEDIKVDKTVLKAELNKVMKSGEKIEGVEEVDTEKLTIL